MRWIEIQEEGQAQDIEEATSTLCGRVFASPSLALSSPLTHDCEQTVLKIRTFAARAHDSLCTASFERAWCNWVHGLQRKALVEA